MGSETRLEGLIFKVAFAAVCILVIANMTSVSIAAGYHILMFIPGLYCLKKLGLRGISHSMMALAAIFFTIAVSVLVNYSEYGAPFKALAKTKYFILPFLTVFVLRYFQNEFKEPKRLRLVLILFILAGMIATTSGLVGLWTGFNPVKFKDACHPDRACGLFGMYMTYGYGVGLYSLIMLGLVVFRKRLNSFIPEWLPISGLAVSLLGLYFSFSRGAWLGFLLGAPFIFYQKNQKFFLRATLGIILSGVLVVGLVPKVRNTFFSEVRQDSNHVRISMIHTAVMGWLEKPVFGLGYRNFEPQTPRIKEQYDIAAKNFTGHAHNNFFEHLASTGLLGFLAVIAFHLFWGLDLLRRRDLIGMIGLPFYVGFLLSGLFQYTFGDGENMFLIMGVFSLTEAFRNFGEKE